MSARPEALAAVPAASLAERVVALAATQPLATAVRHGDVLLGYRDLDQAASRLAVALAGRGLPVDTPVAVLLPRGPDLLVALLGLQKAGLAYLPLEPAQPDGRLAELVAVAAPRLAITRGALRARVPAGLPVFDLDLDLDLDHDRDGGQTAPGALAEPRRPLPRGSIAYIKFTSGSSGRPKPVAVRHANLAGLFDGITTPLALGPGDTWSWYHSPAFGFAAWEIWGALTHGACLAVVPEPARRDPGHLAGFLVEAAVTVFSQTPSGFRRLLATEAFHARIATGRLRVVALSGEVLRDADVGEWFARHPAGALLANSYAITETSGQLTLRLFGPDDARAPAADNAGPVLPGRTLRVAGPAGESLAAGTPGEVWVAGECLADYLRSGDAAGRYVEVPGDGRRWYRTGDLGEWLPDGALRLRGRADAQLKFRGVRIEPAEVEAAIRRQPGVRDAAVVLHDAGTGPARLAAYVVPVAVPAAAAPAAVALWPSLGAYDVYDEFLYGLMAGEPRRLAAFREVLARTVPGRTVLDLGTGRDALLARLAIDAGARHVYAVEVLGQAARDAAALVASLGLADRITVLTGDIATLVLPEPVDACLQGIIGNIGSADGIVGAWRAARRHFAPGCVPLPARCTTRIAPVTLPPALRAQPRFAPPAVRYVRALRDATGRSDLRLCVHGLGRADLLAAPAVFEELDFRAALPDGYAGEATFPLTRAGPVDGFLLWTEVAVDDATVVDYLDAQQGWLPVFLPLPDAPLALRAGDELRLRWRCEYRSHPRFPDYVLEVATAAGPQVLVSRHAPDPAGATAFHRRVLAALPDHDPLSVTALRAGLGAVLPEASVPQAWVFLPSLPLNTNGKLDRSALPPPAAARPPLAVAFVKPADGIEATLAAIWGDVLGLAGLGRDDDFFDLGGDSILAVQLVTAVMRSLDVVVPLTALFDAPTIAGMARALADQPGPGAGGRDQGEL